MASIVYAERFYVSIVTTASTYMCKFVMHKAKKKEFEMKNVGNFYIVMNLILKVVANHVELFFWHVRSLI